MFHTKFYRPRQKTVVLAAFLSDRTESENISFNFLQDGAPYHTSKIVTKWFADRPTKQ
jgi:hypothetical protein